MGKFLTLGLFEKPISEQLAGMMPDADAERLDMDNNAINRLYVRGYLLGPATVRARKLLVKKCKRAVKNYKLTDE